MNEAFQFYSSLVSKVEIDNDGTLETVWFPVPPLTMYLDYTTKQAIPRSYADSHEEKIKSFLLNVEEYRLKMEHLQNIASHKHLSWVTSKHRSIERINFYLVLMVNILLLISVKEDDDELPSTGDDIKANIE